MGKNKQEPKGGAKGGKGKGGGSAEDKGAGGGKGGGGGKQKGAMSINVRHILCEKHGEREKALERLKNGDKFNVVAQEMSQDKARAGGSLGWKTRGSLDPEFEKVAFELPVSSVDNPTYELCHTQFGYHIIMVEGRK
ncbi:peptidyl-prolyl cis-trans isomerase PIN4 [Podospora australis]|uniref:Peptidyl-prolyl cis-trans isomerase n=1 Tax=Podospora australis TaxID=1536484 RepID=A0AAN7AI63_9PEZI|nr:peptidyl-prolyl cis-trans isomerase PIN4 [Podospora australis]